MVDEFLDVRNIRLQCPGPHSKDAEDNPLWWESTYCPRVLGALQAVSRTPHCTRFLLSVVTAGDISDAITPLFVRPFMEAQESGLEAGSIRSLELFLDEPAGWSSGTPVVLTPGLAAAIAAVFPNLESLCLRGRCWASPDQADAHLEELPVEGAALAQRWAKQDADAQAAFAALSPAKLPHLRHLEAPIRVVHSQHLQQLSALKLLHVGLDVTQSGICMLELYGLDDEVDFLHQWLEGLPEVEEVTLTQGVAGSLPDILVSRPPQLKRLNLNGCSAIAGDGIDHAIDNLNMQLDLTKGAVVGGGPRFDVTDALALVQAVMEGVRLRDVVFSCMQLCNIKDAGLQLEAVSALRSLAGSGQVPTDEGVQPYALPLSVRFGSLRCEATSILQVDMLVQLLCHVDPCEELELSGSYEDCMAALRTLREQVPPKRLPWRLGLQLFGSPDWGWQLMRAMTGLRTELKRWPPLACLFLSSEHRSGDGPAGSSTDDWLISLLTASLELQQQQQQQQEPAHAQAAAGPSTGNAGPAAGSGLRTAPGFWCALAAPMPGIQAGGFGAFRRSLSGVLDALPPDTYLHAGRCGVQHEGLYFTAEGCCTRPRDQKLLWLTTTRGPGPNSLQLLGNHIVRFECVGSGRRGVGV